MPGRRSPTNPRTSRPRWRSRTRKTTWLRSVHMSTAIDNPTAADPGLEPLGHAAAIPGHCGGSWADRHRLGTVDRRAGDAPLRQGARAQGARLQDRLVAAGPNAAARHRGAARWRISCSSPRPARTRCWCSRRWRATPALMTRAELEAVWDGGLILMTRRAGLRISRAASTSPGSSARSTSTGACSARCWSPRSSCSCSRWSRRCSSRW